MENKRLPVSEGILECMDLASTLLTPPGLTALGEAQSPLSLLTFSSLCRIFCSIRFFFFSSICSARSRACRAFLRRSSLFLGTAWARGAHQPRLLPKCSFQVGSTRQACADQGKRRGKGAQLTASFLPDAVSSPPPLSSSSVPQPPASYGGSPASASPSPEGRRVQPVPGAEGSASPQAAWYTQSLLESGWGDNTYLANSDYPA